MCAAGRGLTSSSSSGLRRRRGFQPLMSEDSNSDEEWGLSAERTVYDTKLKCWECGKNFPNMDSLMSHYTNHSVQAICHICKIMFRRLTSLNTHLYNVHSSLCRACGASFSNVWELNKHAEMDCRSSAPSPVIYVDQNGDDFCNEVTVQQTTDSVVCNAVPELRPIETNEMRPEGPETSENSVEYIIGEDDKDIGSSDDFDRQDSGDSPSSESDDTDETHTADSGSDKLELNDGSNSSSMDFFNDCFNSPQSKKKHSTLPNAGGSYCHVCDNGPFRSVSIHLRHCTGVRVKRHCQLCYKEFQTEQSLKEHQICLYTCDICGQVFSNWTLYSDHPCPKGIKTSAVVFCSGFMPKACKICKAFFTSDKAVLDHVTKVHTKVVKTKFCILTKPSVLTDQKVSPGVSGTIAMSAPSYPGHALVSSNTKNCQSPSAVNQVINGTVFVGQPYAASLPTVVRPNAGVAPTTSTFINGVPAKFMIVQNALPKVSQVVQQNSATNHEVGVMMQNITKIQPHMMQKSLLYLQPAGSFSPVRPPAPIKVASSSAAPGTLVKDGALAQPNSLPQKHVTAPDVSKKAAASTPTPTIMAMFENGSHEVALMKRMNTGWRSKAPYPCRHCGAMSRQPSLIISHRYLHRGHRSHLCQCGRAFKHRLHLLRHCVQHAEATNYICVCCGGTFTGAKLLAKHMRGKSQKKPHSSGYTLKSRVKRKCRTPFTCDCGLLFFRPSAYIWHQLKNRA